MKIQVTDNHEENGLNITMFIEKSLYHNINEILKEVNNIVVGKIAEKYMEEHSSDILAKIDVDKVVNIAQLELAIETKKKINQENKEVGK